MATTNNTATAHAKKAIATLAAGILPGIKKHFPNGAQVLTFGGGTVTATVDQTVTNLQAIVDVRAAVTTAQANAKVAVATENSKLPSLLAFLRGLEAYIRLNFEANDTTLADFGLAPPRARTPRTAEQKAIAKAKAAATRKARKAARAQASAVQGNVTATLVVTPNDPAAPAPVTTPVAPAPAAVPAKA